MYAQEIQALHACYPLSQGYVYVLYVHMLLYSAVCALYLGKKGPCLSSLRAKIAAKNTTANRDGVPWDGRRAERSVGKGCLRQSVAFLLGYRR